MLLTFSLFELHPSFSITQCDRAELQVNPVCFALGQLWRWGIYSKRNFAPTPLDSPLRSARTLTTIAVDISIIHKPPVRIPF